jgi:ATP synthase protein I
MSKDKEQQRLAELEARIQKAKGAASSGPADGGTTRGGNAGYEFAGTILGCLLIGWLIDTYAHVSPWGIVSMMAVGFAAGVLNLWRALNGYQRPLGPDKEDGRK